VRILALPFYTAWKTVSSTPSEYWKDSFQALVDDEFAYSPTIKIVLHNGVSTVVRVVGKFNTESLTRNNDNYQKILFSDYDYTVSIGDLFVFDSLNWLCTDISSTAVSKSCTVELCTTTLSLYKNHILFQFPAIISNKYSMGVENENNKYITLNDDEIIITISDNVNSQNIEVNDVITLGDRNYFVQSIQDVVKSGLLILKMKVTVEEVDSHVFVVEIMNNSGILNVDDNLTLNCVATDNGIVDSSPTLSYLSSNTAVATVSSSGVVTAKSVGTATITVGYGTVSDTLNITVQSASASDDYKVSVSGASTVKLENNITLSATIFNNGVIDSTETVTWTITNNDASSNVYLSLVSSTGSTITLKSTSVSSYVGQLVTIRASKHDDATVYDDFVVQIKSLF